jgi:hypothetical protein
MKQRAISVYAPLFCWGVYFVAAIQQVVPRTTYSDMSGFLFDFINNRKFVTPHERYISAVVEWLPLIAIKQHCPLRVVMAAYSVNLLLFHFICYLLIRFLFRNERLSNGILLLHLCFVHYSFFWPLSELTLGISYLFLWIAMLEYFVSREMLFSATGLIGSLLIIYIHPFVFFPAFFMLGFLFIQRGMNKKYVLVILYLLASIFFQIKLMHANAYEDEKYQGLKGAGIRIFHHFFQSETVRYFARNLYTHWLAGALLFLSMMAVLIKWRKQALVYFILFSSIVLFVIVYAYLYKGAGIAYVETYFLILFAFWIFCMVDLQPFQCAYERVFYWMLPALSLVFFFRINNESFFRRRVNYISTLEEKQRQHGCRKTIIRMNPEIDKIMMHANWSLAYESILIGTVRNNPTCVLYLDFGQIDYSRMDLRDKILGVTWNPTHSYAELNREYFTLPLSDYCVK